MNLKPKKIEVTPILSDQIEDLDVSIPKPINLNINTIEKLKNLDLIESSNTSIPKLVNLEIDSEERLKKCDPIEDLDTLKEKLIKLGIRFDTDPKLYSKRDYWLLMCILYRALTHLYESNPGNVIVTDWLEEHSNTYVPSEKLVKDTLDQIISNVDESISDINNLIPSEATSSNLLADKKFVHDLIATNASNFRGDWPNWTSVPTDPLYYSEDYTGNKKPNNNDYLIIQNATDYSSEYTGIWRFVYKGDWDTLGKSGWEPQYRVELAFTPKLLNAINSGITSLKVGNYDNYRLEIDDLFPLIYAGL